MEQLGAGLRLGFGLGQLPKRLERNPPESGDILASLIGRSAQAPPDSVTCRWTNDGSKRECELTPSSREGHHSSGGGARVFSYRAGRFNYDKLGAIGLQVVYRSRKLVQGHDPVNFGSFTINIDSQLFRRLPRSFRQRLGFDGKCEHATRRDNVCLKMNAGMVRR